MLNRNPKIQILIADDHTLCREGLRGLLEEQPDFQVVGEAPDGLAAIELMRELKADILLLDFTMPRLDGMGVLRELAPLPEWPRAIVLASAIEKEQILEIFRLGARGLMLKDMATASLIKCIRSVAEGQYVVLGEIESDGQALPRRLALRIKSALDGSKYSLTKREMEILAMVVAGCTNREMAQKFAISEQTVKHHLTHIFDKVGVYNRLELALFAIHHRLVEQQLNSRGPDPLPSGSRRKPMVPEARRHRANGTKVLVR